VSLVGYLVAVGAVAIGACIQGTLGFGLGLIAAPVLALVDKDLIPGPLLLIGVATTTTVFLRERGSVDWRGMKWAIVGRVAGTGIGAWAVVAFSKDALIVALSLSVILGVVMSVAGWNFRPTTPSLIGAGTLSGIMGTLTSIGGPPMALVYQKESAQRLRSTLAGFFLIGATLSVASLFAGGEFGWHEFRLGLALIPGLVLGLGTSRKMARFLDNRYTRPAVLGFSALSSLTLLIQIFAE
jgi:uncharacterized membrane protein YfcA